MPYAKFDDRYDDHKKTKRAWRVSPAAVGLHSMAITYCNRHQTDGELDADWVDEKLALSPLSPKQREATINTLLDAGLFERDGDDFLVHDFLDWNLSRAERLALAEQGRRGGQAKAAAHSKPRPTDGSSPRSSQSQSEGHSNGSSKGSSTPLHSTPTPLHSTPSGPADAGKEVAPEIVSLCQRLAQRITANDPRAKVAPDSTAWQRDMRLLLADRHGAVPEVEQVIDWCQADDFWRTNILSPGKLRKQFTQLVLRAQGNGSGSGSAAPSGHDVTRQRRAAALKEQIERMNGGPQ